MQAKLGSLYQRKKKLPDGTYKILPIWWIQYSKNGEIVRESSRSKRQVDAERLLKRRVTEITTGKFIGLDAERIRMAELFQDVLDDYIASDRKSVRDAKGRIANHLRPAFGEVRAVDFSTQHVKRYVSKRRADGAENATINRELALVRRAFNLASQCDPPKIARVPHLKMLKEANVRTGFLEYDQYLRLRDELPWYIRPLFVVAYHVGGRRNELSRVTWPGVDLNGRQIKLPGDTTKNEEGRTLPIYGDMYEWLLIARRKHDEEFADCPWTFYGPEGTRLYWFYEVWDAACIRAGVPGLLFHDLRRSAVRNMERAGIPRKIAMAISGHKTESVYRRYDIVVERDIAAAANQMNEYFSKMQIAPEPLKSSDPSAPDTLLGTPGQIELPADSPESSHPGPNPLK